MNFDEILIQAFEETAKDRAQEMLNVPKKHKFSYAYRLWERRMLKNLDETHFNLRWTVKKIKYVIVSAAVLLSMFIGGTAYASLDSIGRFRFERTHDYTRTLFENYTSDKTSIEEYYALPEENGWVIVDSCKEADWLFHMDYENGDRYFSFSQTIIGGAMHVNTENTFIEAVSIYRNDDSFFVQHQSGSCSLFWVYDGYLFDIGGNITKSEAIDLAKTLKIVEF